MRIMKTTLFTWTTPIGTFWIRPVPAGRVLLGLDHERLKTYSSAKAAARAVAERSTGKAAWDTALEVPPPANLKHWKRPPDRTGRVTGNR
jgi:hypothetical protein